MSKSVNNELYQSVVEATTDYLGPASQRFVDRHIKNHLNKKPGDLELEDMGALIDWIRVSIAFLTNDRQLIDEFTKRLRHLQNGP